LELIGGFDTPQEFLKSLNDENRKKENVILGIDENNKDITLMNCDKFGKLNFSSSFPMVGYSVQYLLEGVHLKDWKDKIFSKIDARLPLLTSWINSSGLSLSYPISKEGGFEGFDITYNKVKNKEMIANLCNNEVVKILHNCQVPEHETEGIRITQYYYYEYTPKENRNWWELLVHVKKFRDLLTFACQADIDFIELNLYSRKGKRQITKGIEISTPVKLFYIQKRPYPEPELIDQSGFLFDCYDIEDSFQNVIDRWYSFDEEMYPIIHHLLDSILYKPIFKSVEFLTICQALEGFHIRFIDPQKNPNRKFEGRIKNILIKFKDIQSIRSIDAEIVANSRNYYSHLYSKDHREIAEGKDLYYLTKKLKILLTCCFLDILGIKDDKLKEIIDKE
jgi:hypothetical protein